MTGAADALLKQAVERLSAAGIETPLLEAQLLLAHALGVSRLDVMRRLERDLSADEASRLESLVAERARRVPLAYLRGTQEFYGLEFEVSPAVLIPRPETELLVELAIEKLRDRADAMLIDVGTGSGSIAVAAAVNLRRIRVVSIDLSADAIDVARRNAKRHGVENRIEFRQASLLDGVPHGSADLILSNPPYIPSAEMAGLQPEVRDFEPRMALDGGEDGLAFHRRLIAEARRALKAGGWLGVEVAMGQAPPVVGLLSEVGFVDIERRRDLARIERAVVGRRPVKW